MSQLRPRPHCQRLGSLLMALQVFLLAVLPALAATPATVGAPPPPTTTSSSTGGGSSPNFSGPLGRSDERFHEELVVRPLSGDHVNTYFQFTTRWHFGKKDNRKYLAMNPGRKELTAASVNQFITHN